VTDALWSSGDFIDYILSTCARHQYFMGPLQSFPDLI